MTDTMQAAVFMGDGRLELQSRQIPAVQKRDDVLLRVTAASICGSDIQILNVPPGHPATVGAVLGHEYTGEVLAVGPDVRHVQPGDHVIPSPDLRCGYCFYCQRGLTHMCENRTTLGIYLDGGFAPYNVAPARALFKVSKSVLADVAAIGEPLMCALSGITQVGVRPGDAVVVLGAGPLGLLFALLARMSGAGKVIVSEPAEGRRTRAAGLGIDLVVNPREQDLKEVVLGATPRGADVVIDAVGSLFGQAIEVTRHAGKILLFGVNSRAETTLRQFDLIDRQLTIFSSYIFPNEMFPAMISVLESGALPLERLITHRLPLDQINEGIRLSRSGEAVKVIVHP
jgi:(R,R)-butanediol dehydrogenase / meso-butanediol dehydrogenase / diacetyl reductase